MKGFKIKINDEEIISSSSDSVVSVFVDSDDISATGMDSKLYHLRWLRKKLLVGDKIKVWVSEIDKISPLKEKYPHDRKILKERYYKLKKDLENKGLI